MPPSRISSTYTISTNLIHVISVPKVYLIIINVEIMLAWVRLAVFLAGGLGGRERAGEIVIFDIG